MMRWLLALLLMVWPVIAPAQSADAEAIATRQAQAQARFDAGERGTAFLEDLRRLDRDTARRFGPDAPERLGVLSVVSEVEYDLGLEQSRRTDIRVLRIARNAPDARDDLLAALRNIAVDHANRDDAATSARFSALYVHYADGLVAPDDPILMEARAMLAIDLMRGAAPARGLRQFATVDFESWEAFADIGPEEAALVEDMLALVETTLDNDGTDWEAAVNDVFARDTAQAEQVTAINALVERDRLEEAIALMEDYLARSDPEDPWAATYHPIVLRSYLAAGRFGQARAHMAGLLSYPAGYAAALDIPVGAIAASLARQGGVEDTILHALLTRAIEIEKILDRPDPALLIELSFLLGQMQARLGDPRAALAAYQDALAALDGTDDPYLLKETLSEIGGALSALGRYDEAATYLHRLEKRARQDGDKDMQTLALSQLSLLAGIRGDQDAAIDLARRKLALEEGRAHDDPDAIQTAQLTLAAALFVQARRITPELADLIARLLQGEPPSPVLREAQRTFFREVARQIFDDANDLRADAVFAGLEPGIRTAVVADLAALALDADDISQAAALLDLGYETAAAESDDFFDLKLIEGRLAQAQGRRGDALLAFRGVTAHRIPQGIRPPETALAHLPFHLSAAFELATDPETGADLRFQNEMFQIAQMASATIAGGALDDAVARSLADAETAALLRERQNLSRDMPLLEQSIARARYDGRSPQAIVDRLAQARARHDVLNTRIARVAPELATLSGFNLLRMENVAQHLRDDELLLVYVTSDLIPTEGIPGSFVIALSRDEIFVAGLPPRADLVALSRRLRCSAALTDPNCTTGDGQRTRGSFSLDPEPDRAPRDGPAFDTEAAHDTYRILFDPLEVLLNHKKRLIIVADQALVALPFHLALTSPLDPAQPLKAGRWLIRDHSIEIMPTVSSFVAMRQRAAAVPRRIRFLGVGDPLIGTQRDGPVPFDCDRTAAPTLVAALDPDAISRGSAAVRTRAIGDLASLPDTRCELRRIASRFGGDSKLLLHDEATEARIKGLSETGALRDFAVIIFATHGLVAGEIGINDSGLVLTPPTQPTARDDGLLTTEEIAALDLDAEFVILSACNSASGDSRNREGLSGMASAFFFAGARSLMVSHWPVYSDAAVDLTTRSFAALDADPGMARADAVRLAMLAILDDPQATARQSHPAYWAPFMVVGDGLGGL